MSYLHSYVGCCPAYPLCHVSDVNVYLGRHLGEGGGARVTSLSERS